MGPGPRQILAQRNTRCQHKRMRDIYTFWWVWWLTGDLGGPILISHSTELLQCKTSFSRPPKTSIAQWAAMLRSISCAQTGRFLAQRRWKKSWTSSTTSPTWRKVQIGKITIDGPPRWAYTSLTFNGDRKHGKPEFHQTDQRRLRCERLLQSGDSHYGARRSPDRPALASLGRHSHRRGDVLRERNRPRGGDGRRL